MKGTQNNTNSYDETSGFEHLPAEASKRCIDIHFPFAQLAKKYFQNKNISMREIENDSIRICLESLNTNEKNDLLNEIKIFLKSSRREIIENFLIYKRKGISNL